LDTQHLILRHRTWNVRVAVPRRMQAVIGRKVVFRSLKTRDLAEARRLRHRVIAAIHEELSQLTLAATLPTDSAEFIVETARAQRAAVEDGTMDEEKAEAGLDEFVQDYLESSRRKYGFDPETGDPHLPIAEERALQLAHKVFTGAEAATLAAQITRYLAEVKPRITTGSYEAKHKQLHAFAKWAGPHIDVATITRKVAGKYVADVIQTSGRAVKTRKSWLGNLAAFGSWLESYGVTEVNPWSNLSRVMKESTRGGSKPQPRPYTVEEFSTLVQKLQPGSPLLPMTCIAAYSGMRIDEIAAMKLADLTAGAFRVMRAKNENSVRYVPIHPTIEPLVEQLRKSSTDEYLISGLIEGGRDRKRSHFASKAFGRFLRANGFTDTTLNFHSLRRSFTQRAESAAVPESTTKLLTGHARQSLTYGLYSPGPEFATLAAAIQKVSYGAASDTLVVSLAGKVTITERSRRRPLARRSRA
jgi:integrase